MQKPDQKRSLKNYQIKKIAMPLYIENIPDNIISCVETLLIFSWPIGYFAFGLRGAIHVLPVLAVFIIAIRIVWKKIIV